MSRPGKTIHVRVTANIEATVRQIEEAEGKSPSEVGETGDLL